MTDIGQTRPAEILLVEDSPTDALFAKEALERSPITSRVHVVTDGDAALQFLRKEAPYEQVRTPDLILLDLNLPKRDGRELLDVVKSDPVLKRTPVIVLTTSRRNSDVQRAYELHANCYVVKPIDYDRFADVVRTIEQFWFVVATLPTEV
jgi:CheY-like chemotaxis protein